MRRHPFVFCRESCGQELGQHQKPLPYFREHHFLTSASTGRRNTFLLGRYTHKSFPPGAPARLGQLVQLVQRNPRQLRAQLASFFCGCSPWRLCRRSSNLPANANLCGSSGGPRIARGSGRMAPLLLQRLCADAFDDCLQARRGAKPCSPVLRRSVCTKGGG